MYERFTEEAISVMKEAIRTAEAWGDRYVHIPHFLRGLLRVCPKMLDGWGVDLEKLRKAVDTRLGSAVGSYSERTQNPPCDKAVRAICALAKAVANEANCEAITPLCLAIAYCDWDEGPRLVGAGFDPDKARAQLRGETLPPKPSALDTQVGGDHYAQMAIQPVEYITANRLGYCEGSVVKYVSRYRDKGGLEDLKKAKHFLEILIERESE